MVATREKKKETWLGELYRTRRLDVTRGDFWVDLIGLIVVSGIVGWYALGDLFLRWFPA